MIDTVILILLILSLSEISGAPIALIPRIKRVDSKRAIERQLGISDGVKDGIASAAAAAVAKLILQPLDTIKTVQQAQTLQKMNAFQAGSFVVKSRGFMGLWSGVGVTIAGSAPSTAVYFGVYSAMKKRLVTRFPPKMKLVAVALSAAIGNTFASVVRAPLEVIKQRVQAGQYPSALQAIQSCIKEEGILSVWGGGKLTSQLIRDIPYAVFTLMSYEFLQILVTRTLRRRAQLARLQRQEKQSSASTIERPEHATPVADILYRSFTEEKFRNAICGALAGGFGSFMTNPMDLMKTRVMTSKAYDSVTAAAFSILKNEGILTFFVGVGPRLLHKIPANGLFFLCYESFRSILGVKSTSNE